MKLKFSCILSYFILSYLFIVESANSETSLGPQYLKYELSWCLKSSECIALEVADSPLRRRIGLMQRPPLLLNTGMIFFI